MAKLGVGGISAASRYPGISSRRGLLLQPVQDVMYKQDGQPNRDRNVFVVPRRAYLDNRRTLNNNNDINKNSNSNNNKNSKNDFSNNNNNRSNDNNSNNNSNSNKGTHRNVVIILAEAHDEACDTILACELDGQLSAAVNVIPEEVGWVRRRYPRQHTHRAVIVECLGVPYRAVFNGSIAALIYRLPGDSYYSRVRSERPLFLHASTTTTNDRGSSMSTAAGRREGGSVVMCTTMYGHPDKFEQWIDYSKHLGISRL